MDLPGKGKDCRPEEARAYGVGASGEEVEWRHDWGHRLLAVERGGEGGVRFAYDPLGRRIGEEGSEGKLWRVFFAEREVARYKEEAGVWKLVKRMYWGDGVDELLAYDWDGDGDGEVESRLYAVTDGAGSVQALVDETGKVVETYRYGPEGRVEVRGVDNTKPEVRLVRARWVEGGGQRVEVWFSEGVRVESGVVEVRTSSGQVLAGQRGGLPDGRAVWVELASPLVEGQSYTVHVEGVVDGAGNALAEPVELAFSGPAVGGEVVVPGVEGGGLVAVVDGPEGLVVVAGVPVKGETVAGSLLVRRGGVEVPGAVSLVGEQAGVWQGRVLVWRPEDARAYGVGEYVVSFSPALADGAGRPLAGPGSVRFVHRGEGDVVWVEAWQVPVRAFSAFGNDHFLHGRPYVASVGLYDHRARFYEARTGTFLEPDPLGPVDSPNLYAAFGFDALSVTDPFGQRQWKDLECWNWVAKDFVLSTAGDLAVGLVDAATLGIPRRLVREYQQGNVQTFADTLRVAADAVTNTVTLGARDLYEGGASTWEVVKAVTGIGAIQQGAALVGEGLASGDTELALRGVGEFSGGVGIFAGWAAGATKGVQTATKGARTLVRTGDDLARAAAYGMQEWALETEGLANGTARLAVIGRTPALDLLEQRLGTLNRLRVKRKYDWSKPADRELFWRKENRPWLVDKINRGEPIVVVSDPYELTNIYFQGQPDLGPTFFGREVQLLKEYGYRFRRLPGGGWLATPGK